jgi:hypothetical protein
MEELETLGRSAAQGKREERGGVMGEQQDGARRLEKTSREMSAGLKTRARDASRKSRAGCSGAMEGAGAAGKELRERESGWGRKRWSPVP